jgi:hypothetical protein
MANSVGLAVAESVLISDSLGDDAIVHVFGGESNGLQHYPVVDGYNELDDGHSWVLRFAEACL